jgi:hypothetical protein
MWRPVTFLLCHLNYTAAIPVSGKFKVLHDFNGVSSMLFNFGSIFTVAGAPAGAFVRRFQRRTAKQFNELFCASIAYAA